jgi:hypothetical protein
MVQIKQLKMPLTAYSPEFPYKQNQIILSSDRITVHSKKDSIFLFAKQAVSISTTGTVNVDATVGMTVAAPIIEFGIDARVRGVGHPIIKTYDFITQLNRLLGQLKVFAGAIKELKSEGTGLSQAVPLIVAQAKILEDIAVDVQAKLPGTYSTTTYTV